MPTIKKKPPLYVVRCAIWYHLCNSKNVKNIHGGVLILVLKLTLLHGCFSRFLNCTNGTKLRNASHIISHTGTNDSRHRTSRENQDKLSQLMTEIKKELPKCIAIFSQLTFHTENEKAPITSNRFNNHLSQPKTD